MATCVAFVRAGCGGGVEERLTGPKISVFKIIRISFKNSPKSSSWSSASLQLDTISLNWRTSSSRRRFWKARWRTVNKWCPAIFFDSASTSCAKISLNCSTCFFCQKRCQKWTIPKVAKNQSKVVTVAILAQGNNWIMRWRNPFSIFWSWFNSDEGNFFVFVAMRSVPHGNRNQILWRNALPAMQFLVPICKTTDSKCNNRFDSFRPSHDFQNKNECTRISSITLKSCKKPSKSISSCESPRCLPRWKRTC